MISLDTQSIFIEPETMLGVWSAGKNKTLTSDLGAHSQMILLWGRRMSLRNSGAESPLIR